ncbi:MAG: hypothetical protein U1E40_01745 [Amaricoccus sp.]
MRSIPAQAPPDVTAEVIARLKALAGEQGVKVARRRAEQPPRCRRRGGRSRPAGRAALRPPGGPVGELRHRGRPLPRGGRARDHLRPRLDHPAPTRP